MIKSTKCNETKTICDDCVGKKYCYIFKKYPFTHRCCIRRCLAKVTKKEALEYFDKYTIKVVDDEASYGK